MTNGKRVRHLDHIVLDVIAGLTTEQGRMRMDRFTEMVVSEMRDELVHGQTQILEQAAWLCAMELNRETVPDAARTEEILRWFAEMLQRPGGLMSETLQSGLAFTLWAQHKAEYYGKRTSALQANVVALVQEMATLKPFWGPEMNLGEAREAARKHGKPTE